MKARCNPCTVDVGKSSTVTADAQDPDGDTLTYKWSAPAGSFANPAERETLWTAPNQEGAVPATVTVDDGKGGTANDTVNIQVVRPAVKEYVFEDVHFDFDRYSLAKRQPDPRRSGDGLAREPRPASRGRGPHVQHRHGRATWRSANGARMPCATTSRATGSARTGSGA